MSSGAQRGSGFQLAAICVAFVFVLCICLLALNGILAFSWLVFVGHLYLFFAFVIWRSTEQGSEFHLAGICGAFVFVLCLCHPALNGVLGFSGLVYVGHLFFVSVIGRSTGCWVSAGRYMCRVCVTVGETGRHLT